MSDLIWLSEAQMRRIEPYFPVSHGVPRVDDRRIHTRTTDVHTPSCLPSVSPQPSSSGSINES